MTSLWKGHQTKKFSEPGLKEGIVWQVSGFALPEYLHLNSVNISCPSEGRASAAFAQPSAGISVDGWEWTDAVAAEKKTQGSSLEFTFYLCKRSRGRSAARTAALSWRPEPCVRPANAKREPATAAAGERHPAWLLAHGPSRGRSLPASPREPEASSPAPAPSRCPAELKLGGRAGGTPRRSPLRGSSTRRGGAGRGRRRARPSRDPAVPSAGCHPPAPRAAPGPARWGRARGGGRCCCCCCVWRPGSGERGPSARPQTQVGSRPAGPGRGGTGPGRAGAAGTGVRPVPPSALPPHLRSAAPRAV